VVNSGLNIMLISLLTFNNGFLNIFSLKLYVIFFVWAENITTFKNMSSKLATIVRRRRRLAKRKELLKSRLIVPTVNFIFYLFSFIFRFLTYNILMDYYLKKFAKKELYFGRYRYPYFGRQTSIPNWNLHTSAVVILKKHSP
jgi:hypothetical protein